MSHEIYYTSAPEGVKRGSSGFSTVAVSDNIPKSLWDRLESLSAYRHQFGVADGENAGKNPVSWAHWVLSVAGTNHHVLSRICDSGVDHTQRTNAFAHHLVVERAELAAAPAGPAWLLMQPGVMAESWNGSVGTISRAAKLPAGDAFPAICQKWKELTGDAGWGGVLADAFVKSPQKPVCLLFGPGQDILPLLAETIALLPAATRWNVTFNTYFTSMPTSATCLWRCCLSGTPAATSGLRYAGAGIVIDLSDPARLGKPAEGTYVTCARTGMPPAAAAAPPEAAKKSAAKATAAKTTLPPKVPLTQTPAPQDDEESIDLKPVEFADTLQGEALEGEPPQERAPTQSPQKPRRPLIRRRITSDLPRTDFAYGNIESAAAKAAQRRRRQVLMLFGAAVALIGFSVVLVVISMITNAPPELPPILKPNHTPTTAAIDTPLPPATEIAPPVVHAPVIQTPAPLPETNNTVIVQAPKPEPKQTVTAPVEVLPEHPALVTVTEPLQFPTLGQGMRETVEQTIPLPPNELDTRPGIQKVEIRFPQATGDYPGTLTFSEKPAGTLSAAVRPASPTTAVMLWKNASSEGEPAELFSLGLNKKQDHLRLVWLAGPLVRDVENVRRAYWVLRASHIAVQWNNRTQEIAFAPAAPATLPLESPGSALALPTALPRETVVIAPTEQQMGHGWGAVSFTETSSKDGVLLTGDNKSQVVKFQQKSPVAASAPWFIVRFSPGFDRVESTFASRFAAAQSDLKQAQDDVHADDDLLAQLAKDANSKLPDSDQVKLVKSKRADAATLVEAYKSTVAGYNELDKFDIELSLPNGVHLVTLRFRRTAHE
ncbi:MAG: hypothetical protein ACTHN5_00070 [Phycisphaerae bacterium]